jgi:uncharacterized protein (TIGR02453 family)
MLQTTTLKFLSEIKNHNNKEWMDENRSAYEAAKKDFSEFTQKIILGISEFDESIAKANLDAKNCISRLNRDIRFSKDKTPYKTNFFSMINKGGKKSVFGCYYLQVEPNNNSFAGGGIYMPMPPELKKFREEIEYNFEEWERILDNKSFKKVFPNGIQSPETLVRTPKGFEDDSPALEYLKMKGFYTLKNFTDEELQTKNVIKSILEDFKTLKPVIDFLNNAFQ